MIYKLAKQDERVIFIGSDLGPGTLAQFKNEMPGRFFMEGVSEANIIGVAAGLALEGKIPYVNTIATFLTRRCYDQIAVDLCYQDLNVRLIGNGGGLVYAPLGPTHEAIEDIALMRALPNMTIVAPADAREMQAFMAESLTHCGPIYVRLAKGSDPLVTKEVKFEIGKAYAYRSGDDALILTTGVTLQLAGEAAELLSKRGIEVSVVHLPTIKPLDTATLLEYISRVQAIIVVEEHSIIGGLGSAVAEFLAEADLEGPRRFLRIGIPDIFPDRFGSQASLMQRFGMDTGAIVKTVEQLLENKVVVIAPEHAASASAKPPAKSPLSQS